MSGWRLTSSARAQIPEVLLNVLGRQSLDQQPDNLKLFLRKECCPNNTRDRMIIEFGDAHVAELPPDTGLALFYAGIV